MKITSVNAAVISKNALCVLNFYEENFGMEIKHRTEFDSGLAPLTAMFTMGNDAGARFDILQLEGDGADLFGMRVNVDYFEEAYETYKALGYAAISGPALAESSMTAVLTKEGCAPIVLVQHQK